MKLLIPLLVAGSLAFAQQRPNPTGWGSVLYPGLGGPPPASAHGGFGNVLYPGTGGPPGRGARTYRVGTPAAHPQHARGAVVGIPVYYGGYFGDPSLYGQQPAPAYGYDDPNAAGYNSGYAPGQAPVVVLNQQYGQEMVNPAPDAITRDYSNAPLPQAYAPQNPNDEKATIYLVALTDHTILAAIGYWVEGDTLAYITQDGNQNRISLALVDREFSKTLNDDRHVEFRLPKP